MTTSSFTKALEKSNVPTAIVVFGGTGDLAKTKLLPALLDLFLRGVLPDKFIIIGLSRKDFSDADYQSFVRESIAEKGHHHGVKKIDDFCSHLRYVVGSFAEAESYENIKTALKKFDDSINQCTNKLFYLAVPPQYYEVIFDQLHKSNALKLCDSIGSWSRLLVEKPFGKDLKTAQALEAKLSALFADEQIYRIDHYLAKDAIENIVSLRFSNSVLFNSWHRGEIESIDISLLETKDVHNRGSFYDGIGTLRDVGQNHMLQIFALLTMSAVNVNDAKSVRDARAKAMKTLHDIKPDVIIRGQYEGFIGTEGVSEHSQTETYFKLAFTAKDLQWKGVRVTLEAGKALDRHVNEAVITFRAEDKCNCAYLGEEHEHRNILKIQFAPERKISLSMWVKKPGFEFSLEEKELVLVSSEGDDIKSPEAYERVLFDCIIGDQTRFVSGSEVESSWQFVTPILESFKNLPLEKYVTGTAGPNVSN